jgi:hypothetical protein
MPVLELNAEAKTATQTIYLVVFNDRPDYTAEARDCWVTDADALRAGTKYDGQRGQKRHHQLDWANLRTILNRAFNDLQKRSTDTLLTSIKKCAYKRAQAGAFEPGYKNALKTLNGRWNKAKVTETTLDMILSADEQNALKDLAEHFCWMPGNIFLGPDTRTDDPAQFAADDPRGTFDQPPTGAETPLTAKWKTVYDKMNADKWTEMPTLLNHIASQNPADKHQVTYYNQANWTMTAVGNISNFTKK